MTGQSALTSGMYAVGGHPPHAVPVDDCPSLALMPGFIDAQNSAVLYERLRHEQAWPQNSYEVFGRRFTLPRLQTWHADAGIVYSYSDNLLTSMPWTPLLLQLRALLEAETQQRFNAVLVNYYRDGNDYVGWHSDDEIELGVKPYIVSLSLGASREFAYRRKDSQKVKGSLRLDSGCLLIMQPEFQQQWQHSVPSCRDSADETAANSGSEGRINLTFRYVYPKAD